MAATIANIIKPLKGLTRVSPIGLDVGSRQIHAVQLSRDTDGAWSLRASAGFPRSAGQEGKPLTAAEAARIADVLFRRNFSGSEIVLAVPDDKLLTTNLELPPRNGEIPLDEIARAEFGRSL